MALHRLGKTGFRFNALHSFADDPGYDRQLHGHDYEFAVMVEGEREAGKMLFDLRALKPVIADAVIARLDHSNLDEFLGDPSLEALTEWIWKQLRPHVPVQLQLGVTIWETRTIYAEFWGT